MLYVKKTDILIKWTPLSEQTSAESLFLPTNDTIKLIFAPKVKRFLTSFLGGLSFE